MKEKSIRSVIIICGGMSRRMGEDKGSMEIDKKPMIIHVLEALTSQIDEAIIVLNDSERVIKYKVLIQGNSKNTDIYYNSFDFDIKFVEDEVKNKGPLSGIKTGLKAISSEYALVLPCDSPYISSDFVNYMFNLLEKFIEDNVDIKAIIPYHTCENDNSNSKNLILENCEPLHSIYKRENYSIIEDLLDSDEKQVKSFIDIIDSYFIPIDNGENSKITGINFKNINYKDDFY